jgi:tetratricopeptide (TPR) repeat protein
MRFFDGDPFERVIALAIALTIIFVSIVSYLELEASTQSDVLERNAQQLAIETMGLQARGEMELGYAYADAYRVYDNLDSQAISASDLGLDELADAYTTARDEVAKLTPFLQPPYFDAENYVDDFAAYESDLVYVDISLRREQFTNLSDTADQWEQKSQNYIAQLTILTVNLFLFGISNTITGTSRWIFVVFGCILSVATVGLTVRTTMTDVQALPDEAIVTYSEGDGLMIQDRYEEAVERFTQAIDLAPGYAKAYDGRARAYFQLDLLDKAIPDYEKAVELGFATSDVLSDLGFAYYLTGQFEASQQLAQKRVQKSTSLTLDHFDLGLVYLVENKVEQAINAYADGVALTQERVAISQASDGAVPTDLMYFLDLASSDLVGLRDCLVDSFCGYQPPLEDIVMNEEGVGAIDSLIIWLKNNLVALENEAQSVEYNPDSELQALNFFDVENDLETNFFEFGINEILVDYANTPIEPDQNVLIKVYWDGEEDPLLRMQDTYDTQDSKTHTIGLGENTIYFLGTGEYVVELYIDFMLTARNTFYIDETFPDIDDANTAEFGFTLDYPNDWLIFEEDSGLYYIEPPDEDIIFFITAYHDVPDDLNELINIYMDAFGLEQEGDISPATVAEQDALLFDYIFEADETIYVRSAAISYNGVGLIISIETVNPDLDFDNLLTALGDGIIFES